MVERGKIYTLYDIPKEMERVEWDCAALDLKPPYYQDKARLIRTIMSDYGCEQPSVAILIAQNRKGKDTCKCSGCVARKKIEEEKKQAELFDEKSLISQVQCGEVEVIRGGIQSEEEVEECEKSEVPNQIEIHCQESQEAEEEAKIIKEYIDENECPREAQDNIRKYFAVYVKLLAALSKDCHYYVVDDGYGWMSWLLKKNGFSYVSSEKSSKGTEMYNRGVITYNTSYLEAEKGVLLALFVEKNFRISEKHLRRGFLIYNEYGEIDDDRIYGAYVEGTTGRLYVQGIFVKPVVLPDIAGFHYALRAARKGKFKPVDRKHKLFFEENGLSQAGDTHVAYGVRDLFTGQDHYEPQSGVMYGRPGQNFRYGGQEHAFNSPRALVVQENSISSIKCKYRSNIVYKIMLNNGVPMVYMARRKRQIRAYFREDKKSTVWDVGPPVEGRPGYYFVTQVSTMTYNDD